MQYCETWLMEEGALRQMKVLAGAKTAVPLESAREAGSTPQREKAVAVLRIHGPLEARQSPFGEMLGFTSMERVGQVFSQLVADSSVGSILLDVSSPGGMVYGTPELANRIYSARGTKPIIAVANPMAASGAFWIASAADRIVASPSADVGSVGVIMSRIDITEQMAREGVREHVIRSTGSPYKGETIESEPMTQDASQNFQRRVDAIYEQFVGDLARFRGVTVEHVKQNFGKGRLVDAKSALKVGMVDRIDTFDSMLYRMANNRVRIARSEGVSDDWDAPSPEEERRLRMQAKRESVLSQLGGEH